ncbi:hypothetical protein [Salipiger bermudensis]|uniref:Uncharacterized protein n=1 Tax=Salipiger bermudensis (strain DSM 26914 / JCM 13377 / KCTC 12554 / HTCC2601) TaxID=314265 RepID=Q0FLK8_SALBH|nr:hypothetical protein [Salipiger bermudensis]EAU45090.1 hypothetical protein R2601_22926 [Salipiger bermudensis HTCC2601]
MTRKTHPDTLPEPAEFRAWLADALLALKLRPTGYGPALGLGKNTLSHFLSKPGRDLNLGTASLLARDLVARAAVEGVVLDPLPRQLLPAEPIGGADA